MLQKKTLGDKGEVLAIQFLKSQGYKIMQRNYRVKLGEIDIIARENDQICFVEVKTRSSERLGSPFEAISSSKQRKMSQVASYYLNSHYAHQEIKARFDVVSILFDESGNEEIDLCKDAFELSL